MNNTVSTSHNGERHTGYRVFGSEESAFSDKLRMYLSYKGAPFTWITRTAASEAELRSFARFRTLPVLVAPSGYAAHGTSQMIAALEADLTDRPTVIPPEFPLSALALLLEDYADSWLVKGVMHYRWRRKKDAKFAARRVVDAYYPAADDNSASPPDRAELAEMAITRMDQELSVVGLDPEISTGIETSFRRAVRLLDTAVRARPFLFGERPCTADFAVAAQIRQAMKDPTPSLIISKTAPALKKWASERMETAAQDADGPYAPFADVASDMQELFKKEICAVFIPWAQANMRARAQRLNEVEVKIGRKVIHARCLRSAAHSFRNTLRALNGCQEEARQFLDSVGAQIDFNEADAEATSAR